MINEVTLVGRVGQDPVSQILDTGTAVGKFSVATSENYKDQAGEWQEKTEWHNVIVWRLLADKATDQLKKGTLVYVRGKITTRSYVKNDEKRYVTEIVANYFRVMKDGKPREGYLPSEESAPPARGPQPTAAATPSPTPAATTEVMADDDLPF